MKSIFTEMNQLNDHFFKESDHFVEELKKTFGVQNIGGKQVIDLTSIDVVPKVKLLSDDIERNRIYDAEKASNPRWM